MVDTILIISCFCLIFLTFFFVPEKKENFESFSKKKYINPQDLLIQRITYFLIFFFFILTSVQYSI